ncbi:MAG: hypothetical protein FJ288_14680 [Planctomycetes bacterium]|nr:hypothetical protein [Planctomycetota bacterium]
MSNKVLTLIILLVLAAVAFAMSFTVSRWFGGVPAPASAQGPPAAAGAETAGGNGPIALVADTPRVEERHLYDLIKEIRQKTRECQKREEGLAEQERRLQMTRQLLEKEALDLENLRLQAAGAVARLKETQADLEKTRLAIERQEQTNLKRTAAVYDKMDPAAAAQILQGLCANQQEADAVKILYYMTERAVAKVLAELADKNLAARLSDQMKRVREQG